MAKAQREAAEEAERHRAQSEAADRRPCHVRFRFQLDIQCKKNHTGTDLLYFTRMGHVLWPSVP